jgi:hypothetical protein
MTIEFAELLPNDELDQLLLAQTAQQNPYDSPQRKVALSQLVQAIVTCDRLNHPQQDLWAPSLYEDLYDEALQKTLLEICQRIDEYNSKYYVITWVNTCLRNQFNKIVDARALHNKEHHS